MANANLTAQNIPPEMEKELARMVKDAASMPDKQARAYIEDQTGLIFDSYFGALAPLQTRLDAATAQRQHVERLRDDLLRERKTMPDAPVDGASESAPEDMPKNKGVNDEQH